MKKDTQQIINHLSQKNSNKTWALVELHRWQYGELPKPTDTRELDIGKALKKVANGIIKAESSDDSIITPMNLCSILYFLADNYEFEK
jgi:hypothetical protein